MTTYKKLQHIACTVNLNLAINFTNKLQNLFVATRRPAYCQAIRVCDVNLLLRTAPCSHQCYCGAYAQMHITTYQACPNHHPFDGAVAAAAVAADARYHSNPPRLLVLPAPASC